MKEKEILGFMPIYRVNNREENLRFYREVLGLSILLEEGAMVELGVTGQKTRRDGVRFLLEESPVSMGFRTVVGQKRHQRTVLRARPDEIRALIARDIEWDSRVLQNEAGLAFEAVSPEKDLFLVYAGGDLSELTELDKWGLSLTLTPDKAFHGLTELTVEEVTLNVAKLPRWRFDEVAWNLTTLQAQDIGARDTWDIEALEFDMGAGSDMEALSRQFEDAYLDPQKKILTADDETGLELWFKK